MEDGALFRRSLDPFAWSEFLQNHVTPNFPGFTIFDGTGSWQGRQMPSKVLFILHKGTAEEDKHIESIRAEFVKQFRHQSVLRNNVPCNYQLYVGSELASPTL